MNNKQRLKKVKDTLKQLANKGISLAGTKWGDKYDNMSPEDISKNKRTFDNFIKVSKRYKERPKTVEKNAELDVEIKERVVNRAKEKMYKLNRSILSDKTKRIMKHNFEELKPTKGNAKFQTKIEAMDFLESYFKSLKGIKSVEDKINKLADRFGSRLDKVYEFMTFITNKEFQYPIEKELFKSEFPDEYSNYLESRLDEFDEILQTEFKL